MLNDEDLLARSAQIKAESALRKSILESKKADQLRTAKWYTIVFIIVVGLSTIFLYCLPNEEFEKCKATYQKTECTVEKREIKTDLIVHCSDNYDNNIINEICYKEFPVVVIYPLDDESKKYIYKSGKDIPDPEPELKICHWNGADTPILDARFPCRRFSYLFENFLILGFSLGFTFIFRYWVIVFGDPRYARFVE